MFSTLFGLSISDYPSVIIFMDRHDHGQIIYHGVNVDKNDIV